MQYKYVAYNQSKQMVNGKVDAPNEAVAQEMLTFSGLKTVSLKMSKPLLDMNKIRGTTYKIKNKEIIMFSRQLALMIESGFDIAASLDLLESQIGDRNLKKVVGEITADIRNGLKPSQAFAKHPVAFNSLYCRTIAVAEETGNLEKALRQMADHLEKNSNAAKKVKGALMYPLMVMVLGVVVVLAMVFFIVPTFQKMYDSMGAEIPVTAQLLMGFADFLKAYGIFLLAAIVVAVVAAFAATRSEQGKYQRDNADAATAVDRPDHRTERAGASGGHHIHPVPGRGTAAGSHDPGFAVLREQGHRQGPDRCEAGDAAGPGAGPPHVAEADIPVSDGADGVRWREHRQPGQHHGHRGHELQHGSR